MGLISIQLRSHVKVFFCTFSNLKHPVHIPDHWVHSGKKTHRKKPSVPKPYRLEGSSGDPANYTPFSL